MNNENMCRSSDCVSIVSETVINQRIVEQAVYTVVDDETQIKKAIAICEVQELESEQPTCTVATETKEVQLFDWRRYNSFI